MPGFFVCFFFHGQHCTTASFGATRSPSPVPSLSLCRLALAGGGTVKFQHLLRRTPNYYKLLLRPPPTAPPAPGVPGSALGRGLRRGRAAAPLHRGLGFPRPAQFLCSRHKRGGEPAPRRHSDPRIQWSCLRPHSCTPPPPPPELPESLSGVE